MKHKSHLDIVLRLKRAQGHLAAVIGMFEDERSCVDLAQQLHAVENAVNSAKRALIYDHMEHCLDEGSIDNDPKKTLSEFKLLTKYL